MCKKSINRAAAFMLYIYIYTSVNPRISILVLDEAEGSDAELSGAVTAPLNSFFE